MKAFPSNGFYEKTGGGEQPQKLNPVMGMDLRDYFAAKAMLGMLSNQPISSKETTTINAYTLTKSAYQVADAMMKAREQ